jgi:hypothetical protein
MRLVQRTLIMSIGPLGGVIGSAAGTSLSQAAGSETERTQKESLASQRLVEGEQRAENAAGIGHTEQDQESSERDEDGRRLWEAPVKTKGKTSDSAASEDAGGQSKQSKDPTGQSGTKLDMTG